MATQPLLGASSQSMSFHYNSYSELVQETGAGSINMATQQKDGGGLTESQAGGSVEESLRQRSMSSPASSDDFYRVEVKWREREIGERDGVKFPGFLIKLLSAFPSNAESASKLATLLASLAGFVAGCIFTSE